MSDNRDILIGTDWLEYEELQRLTTTSLIDHLAYCSRQTMYWLQQTGWEPGNDIAQRSTGYRNQAKWCLQVLRERGIYNADPYRDDKAYQYLETAK